MLLQLTQVIPFCSFSSTQFNWQLPAQCWDLSPRSLFALPDLFKAFEKDRSHRWELLLSRTVVAYRGDHTRCWQHYTMEAWHSEQMNFTVVHSFSSTTFTRVKQNFPIISYPESIIRHTLSKALIQWWWTSFLNTKGLFHVLLCKNKFVCLQIDCESSSCLISAGGKKEPDYENN